MKLFKKRPSPAMIVAIAALSVSLVGTAFAGPIAEISNLNKKDKRTVRKISRNISGKVSNRRITQRAPGLSVAAAQNANIANVANAANSATNATNAKNAENAENADFADSAGFAENVFSALINSDGTVINTLDGVTSEKLGVGIYEVDFGVPIDGCSWFTALGEDDFVPLGGEVSSVPREGNPNALFVVRENSEGTLVDGDFYAELTC
jgi:predicted ribonuclease toxin of YeeF-YezG toxin-antitoxin module